VTKSIADQSTASIQLSQEQARQLIQKEALHRGEVAERLTRLEAEMAKIIIERNETVERLQSEIEKERNARSRLQIRSLLVMPIFLKTLDRCKRSPKRL